MCSEAEEGITSLYRYSGVKLGQGSLFIALRACQYLTISIHLRPRRHHGCFAEPSWSLPGAFNSTSPRWAFSLWIRDPLGATVWYFNFWIRVRGGFNGAKLPDFFRNLEKKNPEFRSAAVHFRIQILNRKFKIFSLFFNSRGGFGTALEPTPS